VPTCAARREEREGEDNGESMTPVKMSSMGTEEPILLLRINGDGDGGQREVDSSATVAGL
jgi:hypothetical protein